MEHHCTIEFVMPTEDQTEAYLKAYKIAQLLDYLQLDKRQVLLEAVENNIVMYDAIFN